MPSCEKCPMLHNKCPHHHIGKLVQCKWVRWGLVAAGAVLLGKQLLALKKRMDFKKLQASFRPGVVYLFQYPRTATLLQLSPPCLKLEVFLRLAKIPYVSVPVMDPSISPETGRMPFISYNGQIVSDSEAIINFLCEKFPENAKPLSDLSTEQINKGHMIRTTTEQAFWVCHARACIVDNTFVVHRALMDDLGMNATMARMLSYKQIRKNAISNLNNHGFGDVPDEQYHLDFLNAVKAIEQVLKDNKYALRSTFPSRYDTYLFTSVLLLCRAAAAGAKNEAYDYVRNSEPIQAYYKRMMAFCFPDYEQLTKSPMAQSDCTSIA